MNGLVPDISGFLDDKKHVIDRDPDTNPFDDVRHYAYEGDGDTSGSLSSLASCKYYILSYLSRSSYFKFKYNNYCIAVLSKTEEKV